MLPTKCRFCRFVMNNDVLYREKLKKEGFSPAEIEAVFDKEYAAYHARTNHETQLAKENNHGKAM